MGKSRERALKMKRKAAKSAYARDKASGVCVQTGCERRAQKPHVYCAVCLPVKNVWTCAAKRKARQKAKVAA